MPGLLHNMGGGLLSGGRKLQLIRHGATKLNNDDISVDRIRGWKDIPLSPDGRREAERLGRTIKAPDVLLTSDLSRALETAEIIAKHTGVKLEKPSKEFRPWDVGKFAGMKSSEAIGELAHYACEIPHQPVPGGESFNSFRQRLFAGLSRAFGEHSGVVGVVTHHRVERLLKAWQAAGFPGDGSIRKAVFDKKGDPTASSEIIEIPAGQLRSR